MHSLRQYNHTTPLCSFNSLRLENIFHEKVNSLKDQLAVEDCVLGTSLTYSQLNQYSNNIALKIYKTLFNAQKTQFVLLFVDSGLYVPVGYLGILTAGHAIVPITSDTPVDRLRYVLKNAEIALVITQNKYSNIFNRGVSQGIFPKLHLICIEKYMNDELDDASAQKKLSKLCKSELDPAVCIYTSGSTGAPKAVVVPHYAMTVGIMGPVSKYAINAKRRLSIVSCATDAAFDDYFGAFAVGATACIMQFSEFLIDPVKFLTHHNIDTFFASPTWLAAIPHDSLAKESHSIRTILFGSEQISISLLEKWTKAFPDVYFYNLYGPSECGIQVSMKEYHNTSNIDKITIGKPFPGNAFYIVDPKRKGDDVQLLEKDKIGELCIGGIQVGYGYLNRSTETFAKDPFKWHLDSFQNNIKHIRNRGLYRTGILAKWTNDGEIELIGKVTKRHLLHGGDKSIEMRAIQSIIGRLSGVMMAFLNLENDENDKGLLVAFVKLKIDTNVNDVEREAKRRLPLNEVPDLFIAVNEFEMLPNGDVDKNALRTLFLKRRLSLRLISKDNENENTDGRNLIFTSDEFSSTDIYVIALVVLKKAAIVLRRPEILDFPLQIDLVKECGLTSITAVSLCSSIRNGYPTVEIDPISIIQYARTPLEIAGRIQASCSINFAPLCVRERTVDSSSTLVDSSSVQLHVSNNEDSEPNGQTYVLTDQGSLYYAVVFYSEYPVWFVNMFRDPMIHQLRNYFPLSLKVESDNKTSDFYSKLIDPIRLRKAVEKLLISHPVLKSRLLIEKSGKNIARKYSRKVIISNSVKPLFVPVEDISFSNLFSVRDELDINKNAHMESTFCIAYSLQNLNILISVHRGISDTLFLDVLARHLVLYYENPDRKDIPIYQPIDKNILDTRILNLYPTMDKFSPIPCFNFPEIKPKISNGFTSVYYAKHSRKIVTIMSSNSCDALTVTTPLLTCAIVHTSAYLTKKYLQKKSKTPCSFTAGYNEIRPSHIPGYSGLSQHQLCNVMMFECENPSNVTREMFQTAYKNRILYRLSPSERINGVCTHSLNINTQVNFSSRNESFLSGNFGRLTTTKSSYSPVASGAIVVDLYVSSNMAGVYSSFQISHTIPKEIRDEFMPMLMEELSNLQLVGFDIAHRSN